MEGPKHIRLIQQLRSHRVFRNHHWFRSVSMPKEFHDCVVYSNRHLEIIFSNGRILKVWYKHTTKLHALLRNQDLEASKWQELHANRTLSRSEQIQSRTHTVSLIALNRARKWKGRQGCEITGESYCLCYIYLCLPRFPQRACIHTL